MERLQKVIAASGYTSRRNAEKLIASGHVTVNGSLITELGTKVNGNDIIEIDGNMINKNVNKVYFLLNKPRGVVCTSKDDKNRRTVVDLIDTNIRIYPVGRLDYDTTGALILTNDGELANKLMHPKNKIYKTYLAKLEGILDKDAINKLKKGIVIDERKVDIIDFKITKKDLNKNISFVRITIIEGRNHIVKRVFEKIGYPVNKLTRTNIDFLDVSDLKPGEYRMLSIKEVKKLYSK